MIQSKIEAFIRPTVEALGYELWGLEYLPQGKHAMLRVYIDKPEGILIEDCELISHQISALLDVEDPIAANYRLEVSSPGLPRPLFYAEQYARYLGQEVQFKLSKPVNGQRKWTGMLESIQGDNVVFKVGNTTITVLLSTILKAYLIAK